MSVKRTSLAGLPSCEIVMAADLREKYRARQIFDWITSGASSFDEMTNLPLQLREDLKAGFSVYSSSVKESDSDDDNTVKILIELNDGRLIESVLLTDERNRRTACISSQAGCAMGCTFCRTGMMGLLRNLSSAEIVEQYLHLRRLYGDISNVVYMGMGEPLANTDEVIKSLNFFTDPAGLNISARRITLSTCGMTKGIRVLAAEAPPVRLAVSLVSADPDIRTRLMPVTKTNSLDDLKAALTDYQRSGGKRITLECAVIKDINDSVHDAALIAQWSEGLSVIVNVIPWNPASEIDFEEPEQNRVDAFCRELEKRKIPITRRYRRGRGLNAACGQLATDNVSASLIDPTQEQP
ncbi:MAG: 23S rRNA (adenine(2503)-C(2))-methyltransferase RlmN [Spirochaetales bacterium]|nr:23S rRNA (adenine(2503)-C(2))-methyltransferase RlmN [Spirochaetales bacterium]